MNEISAPARLEWGTRNSKPAALSTAGARAALRLEPPSWREVFLKSLERYHAMNKLLAALIAAAFVTTGAFAAEAKKEEAKPAAAAASATKEAKKEEKKAEKKEEAKK
jgi:hypothetical protein